MERTIFKDYRAKAEVDILLITTSRKAELNKKLTLIA